MSVVEIKVFGVTPPCKKCKACEEVARKVAEKFDPGKIKVEKFDIYSEEAEKYGVMMSPTVIVNDKVVAVGKVVSESKLLKVVEEEI